MLHDYCRHFAALSSHITFAARFRYAAIIDYATLLMPFHITLFSCFSHACLLRAVFADYAATRCYSDITPLLMPYFRC